MQEVASEHLGASRLHTAKTPLLCQDTFIFPFPIPLHSQAVCRMPYRGTQAAESQHYVVQTPCLPSRGAGRAWVQREGDEARSQPSQVPGTASAPGTTDSGEVGKIPFLHKCTALLAKGPADLSRAGVSFLGQIFSGFFCFLLESSPTCISRAAFQKKSAKRKYALDMKQTLQYPLICQIISVDINNILQNTACF